MSADRRLGMWTVYDHPKDYPDGYVARLWWIGRGTMEPSGTFVCGKDLEEIRTYLLTELRLTRLERNTEDDPVILECWL